MGGIINVDKMLVSVSDLPYVHVDRDAFLRSELQEYCTEEEIQNALESTPAKAGISPKIIDKIADGVISMETLKVTSLSAAAGIPGGFAAVATVPADVAQYMAHSVKTAQELAYLYGWPSFDAEKMSSGTKAELTLFLGIMFGMGKTVAPAIHQLASELAEHTLKSAATAAGKRQIAQTIAYKTAKEVAKQLGIRLSEENFAKGVAKVVPFFGAVVSGGMSYVAFKKSGKRLKTHLRELPLAQDTSVSIIVEDSYD